MWEEATPLTRHIFTERRPAFLQPRPKFAEVARTTSISTTLWWTTFVWLRAEAVAGCASVRRTSATLRPRTSSEAAAAKTWSWSSWPFLLSFSSETSKARPPPPTKSEKTNFLSIFANSFFHFCQREIMMTSSSRYNSNNNNFNRGIGYSDFKLLVSLFIKRTKSFLFLNVFIHCMHCLHSLNLLRSILRRSFDWQLYVLILRCIRCTLRAWRPPKPHLIIISIVFVRSIYFKKKGIVKKSFCQKRKSVRDSGFDSPYFVCPLMQRTILSHHTHTHMERPVFWHTHTW